MLAAADINLEPIKPTVAWYNSGQTYNCINCVQMSQRITDPSKVYWIDIVDPRFSDYYCIDCCVRCAHDYDPKLMNVSAYLQQLKVKRMVERFGSPYEWNETYKNLWFPEDEQGTVWKAFLGDYDYTGTMVIVRIKVWQLALPEAVVYIDSDVDSDDEEAIDDRIEDAFAATNEGKSYYNTTY